MFHAIKQAARAVPTVGRITKAEIIITMKVMYTELQNEGLRRIRAPPNTAMHFRGREPMQTSDLLEPTATRELVHTAMLTELHQRTLPMRGKPELGNAAKHITLKPRVLAAVSGEKLSQVNEIQASHCSDQGRLPLVSNYGTNLLLINKAAPMFPSEMGSSSIPARRAGGRDGSALIGFLINSFPIVAVSDRVSPSGTTS